MLNVDKLKTALNKTAADAHQQLQDIRGKIQQINDEIDWLDTAALPLSDALKNIDAFVDQRSSFSGIQHFFYQRKRGGDGPFDASAEFSDEKGLIVLETGRAIGSGKVDLSNVICSLFGATVKRQLSDMAKAEADGITSGPPLDERPGLKRDLLKARRALEVDEENIIATAEELGLNGFFRRHDCDPEIVLMAEA